MKRMHIAGMILAIFSQTVAAAPITFTDTNFNLSDYTIQSFSSGQTVGVAQTASMGNPGNALQIEISSSAGATRSLVYLLNRHFLYSPQFQGQISSISLSTDVFVRNSLSSGTVSSYGQSFLLAQNGKYYTYFKSVAPLTGIYQNASTGSLIASDFNLITNLDSGATNSTIHPDFNGGAISLGIIQGAFENTSRIHTIVERTDNFSAAISAVPEPTAGALAATSVGILLVRRKLFKSQVPASQLT